MRPRGTACFRSEWQGRVRRSRRRIDRGPGPPASAGQPEWLGRGDRQAMARRKGPSRSTRGHLHDAAAADLRWDRAAKEILSAATPPSSGDRSRRIPREPAAALHPAHPAPGRGLQRGRSRCRRGHGQVGGAHGRERLTAQAGRRSPLSKPPAKAEVMTRIISVLTSRPANSRRRPRPPRAAGPSRRRPPSHAR